MFMVTYLTYKGVCTTWVVPLKVLFVTDESAASLRLCISDPVCVPDFHSLNAKELEASVTAGLGLQPGLTHKVVVWEGGIFTFIGRRSAPPRRYRHLYWTSIGAPPRGYRDL